FLLFAVVAVRRGATRYVFAAASVAGLALVTKLEYGTACYGGLALLCVCRAVQRKSWMTLVRDAAAAIPGLALCAATVAWMVSLGGAKFLTQENIMSWPGSYFMRTYGQRWLALTGLDLSRGFVLEAVFRVLVFFALWLGFRAFVTPALHQSRARRTMALALVA